MSLATTSLVVVSLIVPLALLVRRQAEEGAVSDAELRASSMASLTALAMAVDPAPDSVRNALGPLPAGTIVALPDGQTLGTAFSAQPSLAERAATDAATLSEMVQGGWEVAIPVVARSGVAVVDVFVPIEDLRSGVSGAWSLLALLGVGLIAAAAVVAEALARQLARPMATVAGSARRLAEGDLDARVEVDGPGEIRDVAAAFNYLARRLNELLAEERESMADLSHRLRTPLTSLRLQADSLNSVDERQEMLVQVDRLEGAVSELIETARSPGAREASSVVLDEVVRSRAAFWKVLADEQDRAMEISVGSGGASVGLNQPDLASLIDVLVENVFSHTEPGTGLGVRTGVSGRGVYLEVVDDGPGIPASVIQRGVSGGGSTGLGLDIARRLVVSAGGTLDTDDRQGGGAIVRATFGESVV